MTEEELQKFRYEEMRDAFEEMMDLHKRTIILAMELHKLMEEDGDPVGIENSKEFLSLLSKQRNLIIMGMVHKVNVVQDEQAANKLIPFPLGPTRPKLDEALHQYIPDNVEQMAKCHAEIIRLANKVGYFYWPLPKPCSSHIKRRSVTVYDCANCNVLQQALEDIDMTEEEFCQHQQEVCQLYRKWLLQIRMLQEHADDRQVIALLKAAGAEPDCIRHVSAEWLKHGRFSGEECHGCPVIRASFRRFVKRQKK
ncbi:MAG: hypothetical protein LKE51_06520 [Selenomonas sp.]|jgi:hypothetical protein|nr:hypothetical protein [Selenomonas sp.]